MQEKPAIYRVHAPLVASAYEDDGRVRFIAIPRGSVLVASGNLDQLGLVDVECDGKKLSVFSRDIRERAVKIDDAQQAMQN